MSAWRTSLLGAGTVVVAACSSPKGGRPRLGLDVPEITSKGLPLIATLNARLPDRTDAKRLDEDTKIVGGERFDRYPVIGAIMLTVGGATNIHCTGTVIGNRSVVTAAHCLGTSYRLESLSFRRATEIEAPTVAPDYTFAEQCIHKDYVGGVAPKHDLAVLYLATDFAHVVAPETAPEPVSLAAPMPDGTLAGLSPTFVGFGLTDVSDKKSAGEKNQVRMKVREVASKIFSFGAAGTNTCKYDSGGPALDETGAGAAIVGITSYGNQDCSSTTIDTRVDAYRTEWLDKVVKDAPAARDRSVCKP